MVLRDWFRQALNRARGEHAGVDGVSCGGSRYRLLQDLGSGEISRVFLAQRVGPVPLLATVKLSESPTATTRYAQEAAVLRELQAVDDSPAASYFSRLLPEVVAQGAAEGAPHQQVLVLRHANGYWGSLAQLIDRFPSGIDPRHAVWIWRRMLEVLGFLHQNAWTHGDVRPEHALVHPQDHSIRLIGWSSAKKCAGPKSSSLDLLRSARIVQVLLGGADSPNGMPSQVPSGISQLVTRAAQSEDYCNTHGAEGLDALLQAEARKAFGPPTFVPLTI